MLASPSLEEWFRKRIIRWGTDHFQAFPWRSSTQPVHQLIAEILLQRTRAEQVVAVFERIEREYPSLEALAQLSEQQVVELIRPLGLHWRGPLIYRLTQTLAGNIASRIPADYSQLVELPGVGPYAANAYLSLHCNIRGVILDANAVRVYGRFFGFEYGPETRRKRWLLDFAERLTPQTEFREYNYALLDLARTVCRNKPGCEVCPLSTRCRYPAKLKESAPTHTTA